MYVQYNNQEMPASKSPAQLTNEKEKDTLCSQGRSRKNQKILY